MNKALLSSKTVNLEAPIFIAWFQCLVSALICFTMNRMSHFFPGIVSFPAGSPFHRETMKRVLPLSIVFTSMIATNNLCLKYVGVAFYYVGRSLTTVFNVILTYVFLKEKTSAKCLLCCAIIIIGFWMGVDQESITGDVFLIYVCFIVGYISFLLFNYRIILISWDGFWSFGILESINVFYIY